LNDDTAFRPTLAWRSCSGWPQPLTLKRPTPSGGVDLAIGWDNSISGNINSSAIGSINNQTVVILTNQYEDVYGSGLHIRRGRRLQAQPEHRGTEWVNLSFQSADADLATLGDYGASPLYAHIRITRSTSLDVVCDAMGDSTTPTCARTSRARLGSDWIDDISADLVARTGEPAC
jgi:hypothetical protein